MKDENTQEQEKGRIRQDLWVLRMQGQFPQFNATDGTYGTNDIHKVYLLQGISTTDPQYTRIIN